LLSVELKSFASDYAWGVIDVAQIEPFFQSWQRDSTSYDE